MQRPKECMDGHQECIRWSSAPNRRHLPSLQFPGPSGDVATRAELAPDAGGGLPYVEWGHASTAAAKSPNFGDDRLGQLTRLIGLSAIEAAHPGRSARP